MNRPDPSSELKRKAGELKYLYGTTPEVTAALGMRRAETRAAFFTWCHAVGWVE